MVVNFRQVFRSPIFLGLLVLLIVSGIKPYWQAVMHVAPEKSLPSQIVLFIILNLIPVLFLVILISLLLVLANVGKMNRTVLTDCTITLGDDMILAESAYARSEVQWAAIQKLVKTRSHILIIYNGARSHCYTETSV
jgi:hypothetical protein